MFLWNSGSYLLYIPKWQLVSLLIHSFQRWETNKSLVIFFFYQINSTYTWWCRSLTWWQQLFLLILFENYYYFLILSWRRLLSYRNQSIDLLCKTEKHLQNCKLQNIYKNSNVTEIYWHIKKSKFCYEYWLQQNSIWVTWLAYIF